MRHEHVKRDDRCTTTLVVDFAPGVHVKPLAPPAPAPDQVAPSEAAPQSSTTLVPIIPGANKVGQCKL